MKSSNETMIAHAVRALGLSEGWENITADRAFSRATAMH